MYTRAHCRFALSYIVVRSTSNTRQMVVESSSNTCQIYVISCSNIPYTHFRELRIDEGELL